MLQAAELGWIAGTLDMKGIITRKNNQQRTTKQIVLVVDSRHRAIVQRLSRYTGTEPAEQAAKPVKEAWNRSGCVEHCPTKHNHVVSNAMMPPISRWQVTGSSLVIVLYNVLPYLTRTEKTEEFQQAMEDISSTLPLQGQGRSAIDAAIRRLANLGWEIPSYILRSETADD